MPMGYDASKQGPRPLPEGHPLKGGGLLISKPKSGTTSNNASKPPLPSAAPEAGTSSKEAHPMQPAVDLMEEVLRRKFAEVSARKRESED